MDILIEALMVENPGETWQMKKLVRVSEKAEPRDSKSARRVLVKFAERLSNAKMKSLVVVEAEEVAACKKSRHKDYTVDNLEQILQRKTFS